MTIKYLISKLVKSAGPAGIAEKMAISEKTFRNKIDPNQDTHHLYVEELDSLVDALNTDAIAEYFAEQRGLMCIKKTEFEGFSDKPILNLMLTCQANQGAWADSILKAFEDDVITWDEILLIKKHYEEVNRANAESMNKLTSCMALEEERKHGGAKNK